MNSKTVRGRVVIASIVLLLLAGITTLFTFTQRKSVVLPVTVRTFEPMAGEWEGTFEMRGAGFAQPMRQDTALSIQAAQDGRSCRIEMRVLAPNGGGVARIFRFTHALNAAGDRIITLDDPNIARPLGEGIVTTSEHDTTSGEWRAAFHATAPGDGGSTDCEWLRRGEELIIVRHDRTTTPQDESDVTSELRLRRAGSAKL